MPDLAEFTPDHPLLVQGRRHAREAIYSAERFGRQNGGADKASTVSVALQFVMSAALVDGTDPALAYGGLAGCVAWALNKVPMEDRPIVLQGLLQAIAERVELPASN